MDEATRAPVVCFRLIVVLLLVCILFHLVVVTYIQNDCTDKRKPCCIVGAVLVLGI
jgi:hypothetical protein